MTSTPELKKVFRVKRKETWMRSGYVLAYDSECALELAILNDDKVLWDDDSLDIVQSDLYLDDIDDMSGENTNHWHRAILVQEKKHHE